MGKKIRVQHYVPQLYLRYFSKKGSNSIEVYDKEKKVIESRNIAKVPAENYFYDIEIENIRNVENLSEIDNKILDIFKTQFIEKKFSEIESSYKLFLDKMFIKVEEVKKMEPIFISSEIEEFSFYIVLQHLRTKNTREKLINIEANFLNQYFNKLMKMDVEFDDYNKDEKSIKHAVLMLDFNRIDKFMSILKNHIWIILKNETNQKLYTSDTPLVRTATYKKELRGLESEGIRIGFPLNGNYILAMYDKNYFKELLPYHNTVQKIKEDGVKDFNRMQIEQSYRFIFCENREFDFVDEVLKNN